MHKPEEREVYEKTIYDADNFIQTFHPLSKITPKHEGKQIHDIVN